MSLIVALPGNTMSSGEGIAAAAVRERRGRGEGSVMARF